MKKLTIAVIFGGCSPEYGVSLQSASAVIQAMNQNEYQLVLIGISKKGNWYHFRGEMKQIAEDTWCNQKDCLPAAIIPNRDSAEIVVFHSHCNEKIHIDAAFPILHGKNGEDGTVQGYIELAGIPLIGCGTLASALCMDKIRAHKLVEAAGISVPSGCVIDQTNMMSSIENQADVLGYPLFVKPVHAGSSFGITKVSIPEDLSEAIKLAFQYDHQVILEAAIDGFEVGCAIMGNHELTIGEVDEIELSKGFFDFTEKYTLKSSSIHVPARISKQETEEVKQTAEKIYQVLGCRGFARVDMFICSDRKIVFNEVNTIPGFTSHSRFPNMMKARGFSFEQVIEKIIKEAIGE